MVDAKAKHAQEIADKETEYQEKVAALELQLDGMTEAQRDVLENQLGELKKAYEVFFLHVFSYAQDFEAHSTTVAISTCPGRIRNSVPRVPAPSAWLSVVTASSKRYEEHVAEEKMKKI